MSDYLERGESVRGSGDDLSNYFYLIEHHADWLPRNVVGDDEPILGDDSLILAGKAERNI